MRFPANTRATTSATLLLAALATSFVLSAPAGFAQTSPAAATAQAQAAAVRDTAQWNVNRKSRLAIQGYDPVAYFPEGGSKPAKGDAAITFERDGVTYRFATAANRDAFIATPDRYEPAHGGWCSWAMREGDKVEIDPASYIVENDRLFLFYKGWLGDTRAKWVKGDVAAFAKEADTRWTKISGEAPRATKPTTKLSQAAPAEPLQIGAAAPDFALPDAKGIMQPVKAMLANGPVVVTFYRGGWCPYCNTQLRTYQNSLSEIQAAGATLVAISPQTPDASLSTAEKDKLAFHVLSDQGNQVARRFGLVFTVPADKLDMYRPLLTKANGEGHADELPITATYVINTDGSIVYAFTDADYRKRADIADVLKALRTIEK